MKIDRVAIHNKYNGRCAYCGASIHIKDMQVDHIRPKFRFDEIHFDEDIPDYDVDDIRNLNPACRACNNWKSIYFIDEFKAQVLNQVAASRKYSRNFRMAERFGLVEETGKAVVFYFEEIRGEEDGTQ